jgi:hypothetical protein
LSGDKLQDEIERSKAITGVSKEVVSNARLVLDAEKHKREYGLTDGPKLLE